jgi:ribonuclease R
MVRKRNNKKSPAVQQDPLAEREAAKYDNPIPSREFIMELLAERGKLMRRDDIAEALGLEDEDQLEALRRRLNAMERDGQLIQNRREGYGLVDKLDLIRGRIIAHPDGFGFLVPDEGGDDLFLSGRTMREVLHGDRVVARVVGLDRRGRREGAIVEVLERNTHTVVGRYSREQGVGLVIPDNKRLPIEVSIPDEWRLDAQPGQFVTVQLVEQPSRRRPPVGRITEVIGDHMAPGMEIDVAIRSHDLPLHWPDTVQEEIRNYTDEVPAAAKRDRLDLRDTPLVTIDGADSRDFDDAVYCERKPKGWRLLVAIADVSHYVKPGSALDKEAQVRGNSVYFPERVIPMLPEILSNGLCSLNPEVDRLCMVCEMYINDEGKITRSSFHEALMRSHARLTYDQVAAMVVDNHAGTRKQFAAVVPHLEELYRLYQVLRKVREQRGAIDFETTETRIVFGSERKIERIVPVVRNDAHKIIEECMIAANVATARFLGRNKIPTLYRVHEGPKLEKVVALREFLGELGLSLRGGEKPAAKDYARLLASIGDRPDAHLIQTVMLRSLSQARYSPDNVGHFGLAHEEYLHFTSPIRRYPDLLVHRAIRHVLQGKQNKSLVTRAVQRVTGTKAKGFSYTHQDMVSLGENCSATERRADEATRDAVDWLKCEYMLDKVGEEYPGVITSVTSFGVFVELSDIFVEGLIHVTSLKNDYYHFDPAHHRLLGERTNKMYRLGDPIRVQVARVDLDERKIDFMLTEQDKGKQEKGSKREKAGDAEQRPRSKKKSSRRGPRRGRGKTKEATS